MWKILLLVTLVLGNEDKKEVTQDNSDTEDTKDESDFPSINILAKSDSNDFSIPQPSLDLSPTSLSGEF